MRRNWSLSSRLIAFWIIGSLLAFFTLPATVHLPLSALKLGDSWQTLNIWTTKRAREIVIASLRQTQDGEFYIEMTDALRDHIKRNPEFLYAAFDPKAKVVFRGSSEKLMSSFSEMLKHVEVSGSLFHLDGDSDPEARGFVRTASTRYGKLGTIVYGAKFHLDDVFYQLYAYLTFQNFVAYLPLCATLSLVAIFVVRQGLKPMRSIAAELDAIDLNSLNQRISVGDLPKDLAPFAEAVNGVLERLDRGVARQKRFTANSAHELRTPIAILRARIDKLGNCALKREIKRDVHRIQTILEQLLVLAQIEERGTMSGPSADLVEIVHSMAIEFMPIVMENDRHLVFESPSGEIFAPASRWAVESIVTNLMENAARAEPPGGTIIIRLSNDRILEVIDHGVGVDAEDRDAIFEPFWRKYDADKGTGLGLAITKELVVAHGWRIWVEETPGGGATFKISFVDHATAAL